MFGDLNFFLDKGLAAMVNPPRIGANVESYSFTEPLRTGNWQPATGVGA
jgi:hypothetical protein